MKNYIMLLALALSIVACDSNVRKDDSAGSGDDTNTNGMMTDENGGAHVGAIGDSYGDSGTALSVSYAKDAIHDVNSVLAERVVYFDFDSSEVSADYIGLVQHHGKYLALNSDVKIRLEGHTDERGTREYNIALADSRTQAVKQLLMYQGASSDQITIISYGEEKPASFGHDEASWRMNRRAVLEY